MIPRTILKQALAIKLYPNSANTEAAMQLLRREIRLNPILKEKLYKEHRKSNTPYFTHMQLKIILEHYSIAIDEFIRY